jgi:hypothetical protein
MKHYGRPVLVDWTIRGGISVFGGVDLLGRRLQGVR